MDSTVRAQQMSQGGLGAVAWYLIAFAACFVVYFINGGALYYFDTGGYFEQGFSVFKSLGYSPAPDGSAASGGAAAAEDDGKVVGSRSVFYSLLVTASMIFARADLALLVQVIALMLAVWLIARVAVRAVGGSFNVATIVGVTILAASLGSLPFYTVYLMPDIFAPILLLVAAVLTAFVRQMRVWEIGLALVLGVGAVVMHPSHLVMAVLLVPVSVLAAFLLNRRRFWVAPLLLALVAGSGIAERLLFNVTVETVKSSEVVYRPFLTARLIEDGPGYDYLASHCLSDPGPTCALFEALGKSDDPWRLTASHIMFERSAQLGSFQLMSEEDQRRVAADQVSFFLSVLMDRPISTAGAFLKNTLEQANLFSIQMTVPDAKILEQVRGITRHAPASFDDIRFLNSRGWIGAVDMMHTLVYAISAFLIMAYILWPREAPPIEIRVVVLMLLLGIGVNAFVCGGISQPADRYGARVIFLLPFSAALLLLFSKRTQKLAEAVPE